MRRHHLCWRQAPFHGVSGATRPYIICPQRHRAAIHHIIPWRVTELYGAHGVEVGEDAAKMEGGCAVPLSHAMRKVL